ncbi:hypothetical protein C8Q73DRAFT_785103 [Cubamyces lactineus]|nr:hypothetical protein C8Q73DRAFT_785103 [Cubamyces lactineus]
MSGLPSSSPPAMPSLGPTYGAVLMGTLVCSALYGLALHQGYRYYRMYHSDPMLLKLYVSNYRPSQRLAELTISRLFDTVQTVLTIHTCYWYLVTNAFDPSRLYTGICFYGRQVYVLVNRSYRGLVVTVAVAMGAMGIGSAIAVTIEAFVTPNYVVYERYSWLIPIAFGAVITNDLMLTGILTTILHRSRTGFKQTDSLIDTLLLYAICTGLITNIFSILGFITALVLPSAMLDILASIVTTKLYVNCVLAAKSLLADSTGVIEYTTREDVTVVFTRTHDRSTMHGGGGTAQSQELDVTAFSRDTSRNANSKDRLVGYMFDDDARATGYA